MVVKANFGGTTYEFPDGTTDDQIYASLNKNVASQPTQEQNSQYLQLPSGPKDQGYGFGEGGVGGAVESGKEGLIAGLGHMAAAFHDDNSVYSSPFEDPNTSRYASQSAAKYKQSAEAGMQKLGTAGQLVAGAVEYAPAMAAGMVNPALGATVAGAQTTGEALGSQYEERGDYNRLQAVEGGAVAAGADLATAGLAGNLAGRLAGQGGRWAGIAQKALPVAQEAATGAGFQAGTNVGTGQDITNGMGEAAGMGIVAGRAMHGINAGISRLRLAGMNKAEGIPVNKTGEQALQDVKQVENLGNAPSQEIVDNTTEYHNKLGDIYDKAKNGTATTHDFQQASDMAISGGGDAALTDAYVDAANAGVPITKAAFDFNYTDDLKGQGEPRHAAVELGSSAEEAKATLEANQKARPSYGKSGEEAKVAGNTWQTHAAKVQEAGKKHLQNMLGTFDTNVNYIDSQINRGRLEGWDKDTMRKYSELGKSLRELYKIGDNYAAQNKRDFSDSAEYESARAMGLAHDLGESSNLINTRGEPNFNPAHDIRKIDTTERMFRSEYPSFHAGNPRATVEKFAPKAKELSLGDITFGMATKGLYPVAKRVVTGAYEHVKAKKSQKALASGIEETRATAQQLARTPEAAPTPEQKLNTGLETGNPNDAAKAAEQGLQDSGIKVPEAATPATEPTAPEANTVTEQINAQAPEESTPAPTPAPVKALKPSSELVKDPRVTSLVSDNTGLTVDTIEQVGEGKSLDENATKDLEKNGVTVPEVEEKIKAAGRHSQELVGQRPTETAAPSFMEESAPNVPSKTARPSQELAGKSPKPEEAPVEAPTEPVEQPVEEAAQPAAETPEVAPEAAPEAPEAPREKPEETLAKERESARAKTQDLVQKERARQESAIKKAEEAPRTPENRRLVSLKKAEMNMYDKMQDRFKKGHTEEEIHQAIQDLGGIADLIEKRGENIADLANDISAKLSENKKAANIAERARLKQLQEEYAKGSVKSVTNITNKVALEKYNKAVDSFRREMEAKGVDKEHIDKAVESGTKDDEFDSKVARASVSTSLRAKKGGGATTTESETAIGKFERLQRAKGVDEDLIQEAIDTGMETGEFEPDVATAHISTKVKEAKEAGKAPKAEKQTAEQKLQRWNRIQEAKGIDPDIIAKAEKEAWNDGEFDAAIGNAALTRQIKESKAAEKEANKVEPLTMKDTQVEMARFLTDSKISREKHPEILKMVENATRIIPGRENKALSVQQTRALMQRASNMLETLKRGDALKLKDEKHALQMAKQSEKSEAAIKKIQQRVDALQEKFNATNHSLETANKQIEAFKKADAERVEKAEADRKLADQIDNIKEEMNQLKSRADVADEIRNAEKIIAKELEGKSLQEAGTVIDQLGENATGDQDIAVTIATAKVAAKMHPDTDYGEFYSHLGATLQRAEEMKHEYPDNPEMWLAREDFDKLKKLRFAQEESNYAGSLGVNLINKVFGRHKDVVGNVTNLKNRDQIAAFLEDKEATKAAKDEWSKKAGPSSEWGFLDDKDLKVATKRTPVGKATAAAVKPAPEAKVEAPKPAPKAALENPLANAVKEASEKLGKQGLTEKDFLNSDFADQYKKAKTDEEKRDSLKIASNDIKDEMERVKNSGESDESIKEDLAGLRALSKYVREQLKGM